MAAAPSHECDVCGARVHELRRGRCWGCYARWVDARPVGLGARCVVCGERRRRMLRGIELHGGFHPMCFACAGQAMALDPLPPTLADIKTALTRERRRADRRVGRPDTRVFQYERRVGQRRAGRGDDGDPIDDEMIIEVIVEEDVAVAATVVAPTSLLVDDLACEGEDLTRIRDRLIL
jgi:hypothetical protein